MANPGGGFRYMARVLAHNPLQGDDAQRYLWLLGLPIDGCIEKLNQGIHDRFCFDATPTALQYIGSDRQIPRGLTETDTSYRARCARAIDDWALAGNAWSVLGQSRGYLLSKTPPVFTVEPKYDSSGAEVSTQWSLFATTDAITSPPINVLTAGNFDWDSASETSGSWGWWRWILVVQAVAPNDWIGPADFAIGATSPLIGATTWSIGFNAPSSVIEGLRAIVKTFKAHWCQWMIVTFDASKFLPTGVSGGANPDGNYGHGWKVVARHHVASRFANARYCYGVI